MHKYKYIALLLVTPFLMKLVLADAQWLINTVTGDEYAYFNPFCKKENAPVEGNEPVFTDIATNDIMVLAGICTPQFHVKDADRTSYQPLIEVLNKGYRPLAVNDVFQEKNYPPPQS